MTHAAAGSLLLLLAACGSPTAPTLPILDLNSEIAFGIRTLPTEVRVESANIIVTGVIQTPTDGYTIVGNVELTGASTLVLEIHAYENVPGFPFPSQNYYRATVRNLAPGNYDLSVFHIHHAPPPGSSQRVYHANVRVR